MPHPRQHALALPMLCLCLALGAGIAHAAVPAVDAPENTAEAEVDAVADTASGADAVADPSACVEPVRLSRGIPRYDIHAMRNGVQGTVRVHAEVNAEGVVTLAEAIDGPRPLRGSASDFIRGSTYSPKTCGGVPVATTIVATVEFNLSWMRR